MIEDYTVFDGQSGETLGEIQIESDHEIPTFQEMPRELEINGFIYVIEGFKN